MAVFTLRESGVWQAKVRRQGWPSKTKSFARKSEAEKWARAIEHEMAMGAYISRDDAERTTFREAADRYIRDVLPGKRAQVQPKYMLARLCEHFGAYSLASISASMLSTYRDERLKVVSNQTVVHELGLITRVFKACAMDWGIALPQGIPTKLVRKPKLDNGRERRLEEGEEALVLGVLSKRKEPWAHAAVVLAIETAARQSELISLMWDDIDLKRRVARFRGRDGGVNKSGDAYRDVPLSSRAGEVLSALPRAESGRVFPISQNALRLAWDRALIAGRRLHLSASLTKLLTEQGVADPERELRALVFKKRQPLPITLRLWDEVQKSDQTLVDLHFHDLRHEATSRLADHFLLHELMKVTGHKSSSMLSRYYHPKAEDLARKLP